MDMCETRITENSDSCNLGYTDEVLHHIGRMMISSWRKLGIYLGIPLTRLNSMISVKSPQEMAMEMFQAWWSNSSPHAGFISHFSFNNLRKFGLSLILFYIVFRLVWIF